MSIHQYDDKMRPDQQFITGDLSFLVEGNHGRLLDGRRTTGFIEKYDPASAMFKWRITKYEDKGTYWDMPAEAIVNFQFEKDAKRLEQGQIKIIREQIEQFKEKLVIKVEESQRKKTEDRIKTQKKVIDKWLGENSLFFKSNQTIDFSTFQGVEMLSRDLQEYMKAVNLSKIEEKTANLVALNPNSGEWIKGMEIVLAEIGLVPYHGKIPRTEDIFSGIGRKENRREYLINRLAFIQSYFSLFKLTEVVLYRGMSTEQRWLELPRSLLSCTFKLEVAQAFSDFVSKSKYKNSYLLKMTCPVERLFMTFLETEALNRQYKEAEALVLYHEKIRI